MQFETGAQTEEVNDLILYADNIQQLAKLRDDVYVKYWQSKSAVSLEQMFESANFLLIVKLAFAKEILNAKEMKLSREQKNDFIKIYVANYLNWVIDNEDNLNNHKQTTMAKELSTPAIEVLKNCTIDDLVVKLPEWQLERNIYLEVKERLTLIGGTWKGGKVSGFVFKADPTELLAQIADGETVNLKKEFQFFGTPAHLADRLVELAEIKKTHSVLEPSAGQGAIIEAINKVYAGVVDYYELMPTNRTILENKINRGEIHAVSSGLDFLESNGDYQYDRIIANPPFQKNSDILHIYHMYKHLRAGGRLVTIASKHWQLASNKKETEFRAWLDSVGATVKEVPAGEFKESGTTIPTVIIVIDKK